MIRYLLLTLRGPALGLLALAGGVAWGESVGALPPLTAQEVAQGYRQGYVLAKPRADHLGSVDAEESQDGVATWRKFPRLGGLRTIRLAPGDTPAAAIARLQATGRYEFVEPDYVKHAFATPNDPDFTEQWGLSNTGANPTIPGPGLAGADIHAAAAWNTRTDASSVVVAVLDTGARLTHTDLVANLWHNPSENQDGYTNDLYGIDAITGSGTPADDNGHGTHVSGIIGAVGNNGIGVSGVAWKAQLMELKCGDANGEITTTAEITCMDFAISHHAAVANASFGSSQATQSEFSAIQSLQQAGIILVAAAGNDGEDNGLSADYPANYLLDNIVAVGCSDNRDDIVYFSGYSSGLVDLFAPGYMIVSLYDGSDTDVFTLSGTSMSTPLVTGSLALLKSQYPTDTYRQSINRLLRAVDANTNFFGRAQTGGRLDLAQALTSATSANTPFNDAFAGRAHLTGPLVTVRSSNAAGGSLWWDWTAPVSGTVNLTTAGSAYATTLGVFTGTNASSLTTIASNSNSGTGAAAVSFAAQAGTTYVLTTGGQNGASGLTVLNLGYANDAFASPATLTGVSMGLTASNVDATREAGEPKILNNAGGHSLWYSWTAPANGQVQISAYSPDFDPLLAVYTGTSLTSLTLVSSAAGTPIVSSDSSPASFCTCTFTATAGTTYAITVDGNADGNAANPQYIYNTGTQIGAGQFTLTIADSAWQAAAGDSLTCSPAVGTDGTIYIGGDNAVFYAFNPNGIVKWDASVPGASFDSSAAALSPNGATVYASGGDGNLYAFATATGAVVWKFAVATPPVSCSPAVSGDGTVYIRDSGTTLYALTPGASSATQKWTFTVPGVSYAAPSIGPDGTLYIGSDNGMLYALTPGASSATLKWAFNTNTIAVPNNAIYTAPAIDASGNLYFGTLGGAFYAVTSGGTQIWSYQAGNSISSSPALSASGGTVYFGCYDHNLYALSTANGTAQWAYATGGEIRASGPAVDANGVVYVGSYDRNLYAVNANGTLNRIYATGDWIRSAPAISGMTLYFGSNDHRLYSFALGVGAAASPWPMYMNNPQRTGRLPLVGPSITSQPQTTAAVAGAPVTFTVTASGATAYQWTYNGVPIAGATGSSLTLADVGANQAGAYAVEVTAANGAVTVSNTATLTVSTSARLVNLSVLSEIQGSLSMGFVIGGSGTSGLEKLLIRGVGPSIGPGTVFNVGEVLPDPTLTVLQQSNGAQVAADTNGWGNSSANITAVGTADTATGAFALTNPQSLDAAVVASLPGVTGGYSATIAGKSGDSGMALTEVYDDTTNYVATNPRLVNLSCLTSIGAAGSLDVGFVVSGTTSQTLLVRVTGPALTGSPFNLTGTMPDPQLSVHPSNTSAYPTAPTAANAGWGGNAAVTAADAAVGAFALTNPASKDSALLITVPPSVPYAVQVSSASGTAGTVLVELYELR